MSVIERETIMSDIETKEVRKVVTYKGGSLRINNVPHVKCVEPTDSDENIEYFLSGSTSFKLSVIAEYMQSNHIPIFDFEEDFHRYPEIDEILTSYLN